MGETHLRAIWFALLAVAALIVGGFVLGFGAALLSSPASAPTQAAGALPPLEGTMASGLVEPPSNEDRNQAGAEAWTNSPIPTGTPGHGAGAAAQAAPAQSVTPLEQPMSAGLVPLLDSVDVNTSLGGIEVVLTLQNRSGKDISLSFTPANDLAVTDSAGRHYELRWAEFDGAIQVPAGGSVPLVRAFFAGLPADGTQELVVTVAHPPQLPRTDWQVAIGR